MKNVARRIVFSCCGVMVQRTRTEREHEDVMYASEAQSCGREMNLKHTHTHVPLADMGGGPVVSSLN